MRRILLLLLLVFPILVFGQFSDFNFSVTAVDETCAGNGNLQFNVSGLPTDAVVVYYIYKLPNTSVPVATTSNPASGELASGDYMVIASAISGGVEVRKSVNVTINDLTPPIPVFHFEVYAQDCVNLNQVAVIVDSGTATLFDIFQGPVTAPPQASNVFTGLVDGEYIFRVYDGCNQAIAQTYTVSFNSQPPQVSAPVVNSVSVADCSNVSFTSTISYPSNTIVTYPLTVVYTFHFSDGTPDFVSTQVITSGDLTSVNVSNVVPYVPGATYTYDVSITNGCGVTRTYVNNTFDPRPSFTLAAIPTPCGVYYLSTTAQGYNPPYTITFTNVPSGFNPQLFNGSYPGPYTADVVTFGSPNNPIPEGLYSAYITDSCNRVSSVVDLTIRNVDLNPNVVVTNNGCDSVLGRIKITIPGRTIISATVTAAPSNFGFTLPYNANQYIDATGVFLITDVPLGAYTIVVVDECGKTYTVYPEIKAFNPKPITVTTKPDCNEGYGTVAVSSPNGRLTQVLMTEAPAAFSQVIPYDLSSIIRTDNGRLYLDGLPAGTYKFRGTDVCGISSEAQVVVVGAPVSATPYAVTPLCNSFNLALADPDTLTTDATYWLQIENPAVPGQWLNPLTNQVYTEGDALSAVNAVSVANNTTNFNLSFDTVGTVYRVLKTFTTYGNGVVSKTCIVQLGANFEYNYYVVINNVYSISCALQPGNVYVDASGLAPLRYEVVSATDYSVVLIDNGTSPVFSNLISGTYVFKVTNPCGQYVTLPRDVSTLPDVVDAAIPPTLSVCVEPGESVNIPVNLTSQNTAILNGAVASLYSISYFTSQADADANSNAIASPEAYYLQSNPQTIYARLNQVYINLCPEVVSFVAEVGAKPTITVDNYQFLCKDIGSLTLSAGAGFDSYLWQPGGQTTADIVVTETGDYSVTVTSHLCSETATITVAPLTSPVIHEIEIFDWTLEENGFTVVTDVPHMYVYSIDGQNYQESNTFTGLPTGIYTVYVKDKQGCDATKKEFALLYYPKFFSPNADGVNDYWRIKFSSKEPNLQVYIFDRYGKLITGFPSQSVGWDGTLNGHPLPATDYWFVVTRQDGRIYKGHFSLIR